ncbi:SIS domain-containing protein [Neobacillus drentensis]|uniref:SIS domain-containing protein n=1 Tax=Neobacillus drentensis TaxID=220684 RepID=UPI001F188A91|nr:SIS domain-containing protein [Neobacillus drentensis]ULT59520.1 SIS domain-containing protein [Neobacillus drentensis]
MMNIKEIICSIKEQVPGKTIDTVYFVACGGSYGGFYPAFYLLEHESTTLRTAMFTSNEFVHALPKNCGHNTIVICCSMRGTPETIEAARIAREAGAVTIALYVLDSKLTENSDYRYKYQSIAEEASRQEEVNSSVALRIAFEILEQFEGYEHYEDAMKAFNILDDIYKDAVKFCKPRAKAFSEAFKNEECIYVLGAGPSMGAAYIFSICNLMEMQWIHSPTVNHGELLHGPFEAIDKNTPLFILMSEGRTRAVDVRALKFLQAYGEKLVVLDAKDLGINRISDSVSEYFNHLIFAPVLNNVFLRELAKVKKHPYTNRRYMWKVKY